MARACRSCGVESPDEARYCAACGAPLHVPEPGGERKLATVLFADLTEFTTLGERLDPERLDEIMRAFFAEMRDAIEAQDGTVEKFIGDAVMAVFGVPAAHEDDPDRALAAAIEMGRRLERLNADLGVRHGLTLAMRIGINTGEVLARIGAGPEAGLVAGDPVNVAARLEAAANSGQVLVGERTVRASRRFRFDPVGPLAVRGKALPVPAYTLLGPAPEGERRAPGLRAPMVGRDRELDVLTALYRRIAAERRPHLVTIYGDPGVGKSRLAGEFTAWVARQDGAPQVVRGRCLPSGAGVTYWPLAEILKGLAGVLDTDPPQTARAKLRRLGAERLPPTLVEDPARATAALAYTVGVDDPEAPFTRSSPRQVQTEIKSAWRSFFSALAAEAPLVALIEDIHWADPALLDLLEDLAARVQGPVLFLCPSRPELTGRRPGWGGGHRASSTIALEPLAPGEADRLARLLLDVEDLPRPLRRRILERAEGNPFFLEEILRQLIDEGWIRREGARWRAAEDTGGLRIPDSLQAVLAARIDLLEPIDKRILQRAAVVGRVFWTGPVRALSGAAEDELADALARLETRDLVVNRLGSAMAGEEEWIFKHVLTRDVAYASLPRRERATAHERVAEWLAATAGARRHEVIELLAHHWAEAHAGAVEDHGADVGRPEELRALAYETVMVAANDAHRRLALAAAQRLAAQARGLAGDPAEEASALELLGIACFDEMRGDGAWRAFGEAVDVLLAAGAADARIPVLCAKAAEIPARWIGTTSRTIREEDARRYLDIGFAHARAGDGEARARLLTVRAFWGHAFPDSALTSADGHAEREAGEEAAAMAERIGRPDLALAALDALESSFLEDACYAEALEVVERRPRLVGAVDDPLEQGDTYAMAASCLLDVGRFDEAIDAGTQGFQRTLATLPVVAMHCLSWRALARFGGGDWDGFLADLALHEDMLGERRDEPPTGQGRPYAVAALVHEVRGDRAAAGHYLGVIDAIEHGRVSANLSPWPVVALARRGRFDAARGRLEAAGSRCHRDARGRLAVARCEVVCEQGTWDEAADAAAEVRAGIRDRAVRTLAPYAERLEGRAALAQSDPERAVPSFERALRGFGEIHAEWERARTGLWLAEARVALGRDGEPAVKAALPALRATGSRRELAQADDLRRRSAVAGRAVQER